MIVSLVILVFLWHIPSAIVPIITIPVSVFLAFIPLYFMGVTSNIMSLAGIAISIGVLVDGAIVEVENAYKRLEEWIAGGRKGDFHEVRLRALKEVGPSVFFSLLVIGVSFLPVFTLVDQEGRLFKPLAYSKNLAMAIAAVLAITLDPALRMLFTRMEPFAFRPRVLARIANTAVVGRYYAEERHPISRILFAVYEPVCRFVLRHRALTLGLALLLMALDGPGLPAARLRVHAAAQRGRLPLHADRAAGHVGHRGAAHPAGPGPDAARLPRGGARLRQGGSGDDADRPGAVLHGGDDGAAQAGGGVAARAALVLELSAAAAVAVLHRASRASHLRRAARRDGRGAPLPRHPEHLDHADPEPHRHAVHRRAHADRHQGPRSRPEGHPAHRGAARGHPPRGPGHAQRARRAHGRRLLRGLRPQPRRARPLRAVGGGRADDRHVRDRRRDGHHHGRGARALLGERALRARVPRQRGGAAPRAGADPVGRPGADGPDRGHPAPRGTVDDPRRERPARRLRLRGHGGARRRRLRPGGEAAGAGAARPAGRATPWSGAGSTRTWPGCASG